jgi:hypothetical protein
MILHVRPRDGRVDLHGASHRPDAVGHALGRSRAGSANRRAALHGGANEQAMRTHGDNRLVGPDSESVWPGRREYPVGARG